MILGVSKCLELRNYWKGGVQVLKDIVGDVAIVEHASQYYKELFGPCNHTDFHIDPNYWEQGEKINVQENEELSKEFSFNKIKEVVFSMERNTAPRPDHFPIEFYQHCWDTIKVGRW